MKCIMAIISGLLGLLAALGFICPAVAQLRTQGALPTLGVITLFLGVLLAISGGIVIVYGVRKRGVLKKTLSRG